MNTLVCAGGINRRSDVLGIFPSECAIQRLVNPMLLEQDGE